MARSEIRIVCFGTIIGLPQFSEQETSGRRCPQISEKYIQSRSSVRSVELAPALGLILPVTTLAVTRRTK